MTDEQTNESAPANESGSGNDDWTPPATPAEMRRILSQRVAREREKFSDYASLKEKAERFDALEEASKSEQQKLIERLSAAEQHAKDMESRSLRAEVAAAKGVPLSALAGSTREELESAADSLIAWRNDAAKSNALNKRGGFYSGASAPKDSATDPKARAAAALRELGRSS